MNDVLLKTFHIIFLYLPLSLCYPLNGDIDERDAASSMDLRDNTTANSTEGNSTSLFQMECGELNGVCGEGIANMVVLVIAVTVIGVMCCIVYHWEIQPEFKNRLIARLRHRNRSNNRTREIIEERNVDKLEITVTDNMTDEDYSFPLDTTTLT
jgi:hypothetical protein